MSVGMSDKLINMRARPPGHFAGFETDRPCGLFVLRRRIERQTGPAFVDHNAMTSQAGLKANLLVGDSFQRSPCDGSVRVYGRIFSQWAVVPGRNLTTQLEFSGSGVSARSDTPTDSLLRTRLPRGRGNSSINAAFSSSQHPARPQRAVGCRFGSARLTRPSHRTARWSG